MLHEGKTVLVLGGGIGGLVTANELRKLLPQPHPVAVKSSHTAGVLLPQAQNP